MSQLKLEEIDDPPVSLVPDMMERRALVKIALGHDPVVSGAILVSSVVHWVQRFEGPDQAIMLGRILEQIIRGVGIENQSPKQEGK